MLTKIKEEKKVFIVNEFKEVLNIMLYLAVSLCLVATFKAMVLIQLNINEFVHLYSTAIIEAAILGKVVALTQKLPIMNACDQRPLVWSILYKSVLMTLIVDLANTLEDQLLDHHSTAPLYPLIFLIAQQTVTMGIFLVLYTARGIDHKLGDGTILKVLTEK